MGRYLSPPTVEDVENSVLKCAVIWYPSDSGLFFQNAVRGALSELRYSYRWEGSKLVRDAIVQKFIDADLKTDGSFFVTDCELLDEALEDGEMAINVTVNNDGCGCGCGSGGGGTIEYPPFVDDSGVVIPPLPPVLPEDDGVSIPDGFESYEEYREYKCGVATQMVDDFNETIGNLQSLGGLLAVGAGYAIIQLGSAATYSAVVVGIAATGLSVGLGIVLLSAALIALIAGGAAIFDHFQDIRTELLTNREQFICDVYNASNATEARQVFYDTAGVAVTNLGLDVSVQTRLSDAVVGIIDALVPAEVVITLFQFIESVGYEDFDCSTCGAATPSVFYDFALSEDGWTPSFARAAYNATTQSLNMHGRDGLSPDPTHWILQRTPLLAKGGSVPGQSIQVTAIDFDILQITGDSVADGKSVKIQLRFADMTTWTSPDLVTYGNQVISGFPVKELRSDAGGEISIIIYHYSNGSGASSEVGIDNFSLSYDEI